MDRILICFAALICFSGRLQAESPDAVLERFVGAVASSAVDFGYSYLIDDGRARVKGGGTVAMQGESYLISGDGLEVYCDGKTRWTVDRAAMEVVVETCDPENPDYTVNPAVLLKDFDKAFSVESSGVSSDGSLHYSLSPVSAPGISSLEIVLSGDGKKLLSAVLHTEDGAAASFSISSFVFSTPSDPSRFAFDISSLADGYIVTDLTVS